MEIKIGAVREYTKNILVCNRCGFPIDITLCSYGCPKDGDHHGNKGTILQVWKCHDELIKVE